MLFRSTRERNWPVTLTAGIPAGEVQLRPCTFVDEHTYLALRLVNHDWLAPWDATTPENPTPRSTSSGFREMVRSLTRRARAGTHLPWFIWFRGMDQDDHRLVGQLTVGPIVGGSARTASLGYWIDEAHAGRGIMTAAVALSCDHLILQRRLHRVEINIRPENRASLRVVEKLGFRDEGLRRRYLHIGGEWADHQSYALTAEEVGEGLLARKL